MKYYLTKGPIISALVCYRDLLYYTGGIYSPKTTSYSGLHAVCVVGYDDNQKCWIIKNSWGTQWGERGYARVAYGTGKIEIYTSSSVTTK